MCHFSNDKVISQYSSWWAHSSVSQKQNSSCPVIMGMIVQPDSPEARGKQPRLPKYFHKWPNIWVPFRILSVRHRFCTDKSRWTSFLNKIILLPLISTYVLVSITETDTRQFPIGLVDALTVSNPTGVSEWKYFLVWTFFNENFLLYEIKNREILKAI